MVWLNSKDIKVRIPSKKLGDKYLGPFEIIEHIGDLDYKLKLPHNLHQLHNNFHIDKLYHWKGNKVNGLLPPPPEPVIIDKEEELEVDKILESQIVPGRGRQKASRKYLVSWKGYDGSFDKWEPEENLANAKKKIADFHKRHPRAPKLIKASIFATLPWQRLENFNSSSRAPPVSA
jgi:Chromo (CHRromatin Organisation MOdifier) domain